MDGLHLIADLHDCRCEPERLLEIELIRTQCLTLCQKHQLTIVGELFHPFTGSGGEPAGITGAVVLAESHLAVHTWPERAGVTLDVYVCNFSGNNSGRAKALFEALIAWFTPGRSSTHAIRRGDNGNQTSD